MNDAHREERYYSEISGRPPLLMACLLFGSLAGLLILAVFSRPQRGLEEMLLLGVAVLVLIGVAFAVRQLYSASVILTSEGIIVRKRWSTVTVPYRNIQAMAAYTNMYRPRRFSSQFQSRGAMHPRLVDHLLIRTATRVHHFVLTLHESEKILDAMSERTGLEIRELDNSSQGRKWSRGKLDEISE